MSTQRAKEFRVEAFAAVLALAAAASATPGCTLPEKDKAAAHGAASGASLEPPPPTKPLMEYTVQKGDSLWKLARDYSTTIQEIKDANRLEGDLIRAGDKILIPTDKATQEQTAPAMTVTPGEGTQPIEGAPATPPSLQEEFSIPPPGAAPTTAEDLRSANIRYFSNRPATGAPLPENSSNAVAAPSIEP